MKAKMNKTIKSTDYDTVIVDEFDVLVDTNKQHGRVVGLKVTPRTGNAFIMPIAIESAKELAFTIFKTCLFAAPEMFEFPQVA